MDPLRKQFSFLNKPITSDTTCRRVDLLYQFKHTEDTEITFSKQDLGMLFNFFYMAGLSAPLRCADGKEVDCGVESDD